MICKSSCNSPDIIDYNKELNVPENTKKNKVPQLFSIAHASSYFLTNDVRVGPATLVCLILLEVSFRSPSHVFFTFRRYAFHTHGIHIIGLHKVNVRGLLFLLNLRKQTIIIVFGTGLKLDSQHRDRVLLLT